MNNFDCSRYENPNLFDQKHYISLNLKSYFVTGRKYFDIFNF